MRYAGAEADDKHPYGHGKFEVLGALGIVIFLAVASFELLKSAVGRLVAAARRRPTSPASTSGCWRARWPSTVGGVVRGERRAASSRATCCWRTRPTRAWT